MLQYEALITPLHTVGNERDCVCVCVCGCESECVCYMRGQIRRQGEEMGELNLKEEEEEEGGKVCVCVLTEVR